MAEKPHAKPYHAPERAPGQEAADALAEVMKHAAERKEAATAVRPRKSSPKWMLPASIFQGVLALYFLLAQPEFVVVNPNVDERPTAQRVELTRHAMFLGITRIEQFRSTNGRLPQNLEEAGSTLARDGVQYTPQGTASYLLVTDVDGETIVFDSASQTPAEFAGNMQGVVTG